MISPLKYECLKILLIKNVWPLIGVKYLSLLSAHKNLLPFFTEVSDLEPWLEL